MLIIVVHDQALTLHLSDQRIDDARQLRFFQRRNSSAFRNG
jgi:hypothetical protein